MYQVHTNMSKLIPCEFESCQTLRNEVMGLVITNPIISHAWCVVTLLYEVKQYLIEPLSFEIPYTAHSDEGGDCKSQGM